MKIAVSFCLFLALLGPGVSVANLTPDEQRQAIEQLGAEKWSDRQAAREKVDEWARTGFDSFAALAVREMEANEEPEIRLQLRDALKSIIVDKDFFAQGFLGIQMAQAVVPVMVDNREYHPVDITQVIPDCAAIKHDMRAGDRILSIDGKACHRQSFPVTQFTQYIRSRKPGETVKLLYLSAGRTVAKQVVLGKRPEELSAQSLEERQEQFFEDWLQRFRDEQAEATAPGP